MFLSVFDMFKIGIGPSSSHTMGPMVAAGRFLRRLGADRGLDHVSRVCVRLHGSLAFTGKGHGTDTAVVLGFLGKTPETLDPDAALAMLDGVAASGELRLGGDTVIRFDVERDIIFDFSSPLEGHANGLVLEAFDADGKSILQRTYFSIGGGFVLSADELIAAANEAPLAEVPHGFKTAVEMLAMGDEGSISIAGMKMANEATVMSESEVRAGLDRI